MIKRVIACFTICLIITGLINPVFSDASALPQPNWSDPGISEVINISDLTGWMLNGGTYDVSSYTNAESFMNDYFYARTSTKLSGTNLFYNQFGIGQDLYNIGAKNFSNRLDTNRMMSSSFREHSGYGRRFSEQANDALLSTGNLYDMKIPLLNEVEFSNFVGYNHDALRLYSEFFTTDHDDPTPNPDINYIEYIERINGHNEGQFFWYNAPQVLNGWNGYKSIQQYPYYSYSWFKYPFSDYGSSSNKFPRTGTTTGGYVYCSNILDLYINSTDNGYIGTINNMTALPLFSDNVNNFYCIYFNYSNNTWSYGDFLNQTVNNYSKSLNRSTLAEVLEYFSDRVRNVNIYVDGVPWSIVSMPENPTITPEFPDAVGGDELPTTTWPISRPRAPYYISVPGILQAIEDAIQDDGKLDIDDLKPYLTDKNGDPVPDPEFDPEPIPIPVPDPVNPDVVPGLPEIPAIPIDMPGYNGVSVLAEIINFTNQSLPTSLIITFWGIVFGIVILGLIKILHK